MSNRLANYFIAGALVSALALASPALARGGGGGGMGMGGGGGGMGMGTGHGMGGAMGIGTGHGMGSVTGMHSMGMVGHPMGVAPHVGARSFATMPMSRAAFAHPVFSHPVFPHHAFFHHHHNRFNRFAFVGGGDYFYAGYDDCWRRVWTAYGPQWVNLCADYGYGY
jgi:hypothetical protein